MPDVMISRSLMAMIEYGNLNQLLPQRSVTKNQAYDFGLKRFRLFFNLSG
jgi:hypothetical protein